MLMLVLFILYVYIKKLFIICVHNYIFAKNNKNLLNFKKYSDYKKRLTLRGFELFSHADDKI